MDTALRFFKRVNVDLMYGLPEQSLQEAESDLETAILSGVGHLSTYELTLESNTLFGRFPPKGLPTDDVMVRIESALEARLQKAGFEHYEVSAFAKKGECCLHNLNYWLFGDYLGIGAGAHSKLTLGKRVWRSARFKHPKAYVQAIAQKNPIEAERVILASSLGLEFMMNALRLKDGFSPTLFLEHTGEPLESIQSGLDLAKEKGLLVVTPHIIKPTKLGMRFLNNLLLLFA